MVLRKKKHFLALKDFSYRLQKAEQNWTDLKTKGELSDVILLSKIKAI